MHAVDRQAQTLRRAHLGQRALAVGDRLTVFGEALGRSGVVEGNEVALGRARQQEARLLEALAHGCHPEGEAPAGHTEGGAGVAVGTPIAPSLHGAIAIVEGTTGEHVGPAGEGEPQATADHEDLEPIRTVAHEHHRRRVANGGAHR